MYSSLHQPVVILLLKDFHHVVNQGFLCLSKSALGSLALTPSSILVNDQGRTPARGGLDSGIVDFETDCRQARA